MERPNYKAATLLCTAGSLDQLPADVGAEIAFIGRSNAGKSSAINTITGVKGLARTSKTPGRTQTINVFPVGDRWRLVDLPGYGYAKVPLSIKQRLEEMINEYLQERQCLRGLVLIMDIRHPLKETDQQMIDWCVECEIPIHILLTKADKLKRSAMAQTLLDVRKQISEYDGHVTVQLFSSHNGMGVDQAHQQLDQWLLDGTS